MLIQLSHIHVTPLPSRLQLPHHLRQPTLSQAYIQHHTPVVQPSRNIHTVRHHQELGQRQLVVVPAHRPPRAERRPIHLQDVRGRDVRDDERLVRRGVRREDGDGRKGGVGGYDVRECEGGAGDSGGIHELGQGTLLELGYGCTELGEGDEDVARVVEDGGIGGGRKLRKEARFEH